MEIEKRFVERDFTTGHFRIVSSLADLLRQLLGASNAEEASGKNPPLPLKALLTGVITLWLGFGVATYLMQSHTAHTSWPTR